MKWFSVIRAYEALEQPYVSDTADLRGIEDWRLAKGSPIEDWRGDAWIRCSDPETDGPPDDALWNHLGLPIFSMNLRRELDHADVRGIQYLPIHVLRPDRSEISGYAVANLLNVVSALDMERSGYSLFEPDYFIAEHRGKVSSLWRAVLMQAALSDYHIIRLAEFTEAMFVSEKFVTLFEDNSFTGWSFEPSLCV